LTWRTTLVFLAKSFVPWIVFYLLLVSSYHYGVHNMSFWRHFTTTIGNGVTYWLLTPAVIVLAFRATQARRWHAALFYAAGAAAFCTLHPLIRTLMQRIIGAVTTVSHVTLKDAALLNLWTNLTIYAALVCGATAFAKYVEARRRALRQSALRAELNESRLRLLKAQIHPHFLFNTLHDISGLMATDIKAARDMMGRLEELLHIAVKDQAEEMIPLSQELEFLNCYLELEKMRLGDRLTVRLEVDRDTLSAMVPSMLLQPVVENSIKHGIAKFSKRGWLRIASRRVGDTLRLVVEDSGPGIGGSAKPGVGLANTEARLNHHYARQQSIEYTNLPVEGFRCEISVPFSAGEAKTKEVAILEYTR
jgi:signal transduction histidine kinase